MSRALFRRWLLPVAGLLTGIAAGVLIRHASAPDVSAPAPRVIRRAADLRPAVSRPASSFDRASAAGKPAYGAEIEMEQLVMALTPGEARNRAKSDKIPYRLKELLWYRAAAENPPNILSGEPKPEHTSEPVLRGVFRAWVRRDIAAALRAAGDDKILGPACVGAWAAYDPLAASAAVDDGTLSPGYLPEVANAWLRRDPAAAFRWIESISDEKWAAAGKNPPLRSENSANQYHGEFGIVSYRNDVKGDLLQDWTRADPVAGFQAAAATEWGRPHSLENPDNLLPDNPPDKWLRKSFAVFAELSPELAARAAAALPHDRLTEKIASSMASDLEKLNPDSGVQLAHTFPPGSLRKAALSSCASEAVGRGDYDHAKELVMSVDDPAERAAEAAKVLSAWTYAEPRGARNWLRELERDLPPDLARIAADAYNSTVKRFAPSLATPK
jgi:hypothetical protein